MFTMKKIALLGAAGLAAFAMSCSDTDDDAENSITKPDVTLAGGSWSLTGGAVIASSSGIDSVFISLVDGSDANVAMTTPLLPQAFPGGGALALDIAGTYGTTLKLNEAMLTACKTQATVTAYLKIRATFAEGPAVSTKSDAMTFTCEGGGIDVTGGFDAGVNTPEVGATGHASLGSSIDLDANVVYTSGQVTGTDAANIANRNKVDVVYNGTNLYSAYAFGQVGTGASNLKTAYAAQTTENTLYPITSAEWTSITSATDPVAKAGEIMLAKYQANANEYGPAEVGNRFLVMTTEEAIKVVTVATKTGTTSGSAVFLVMSKVSN